MTRRWVKPILFAVFILAALALAWQSPVQASRGAAQIPTVDVPTVTGTPSGARVIVQPGPEPQVNLRSGPNSLYDKVGILLIGQSAPALGRTPGSEWIKVEYPGAPGGVAWVYAALVKVDPPNTILPIVEPPPTPTPATTATIDPTLAARFVVTQQPTRLATYTPPPPLQIPTYTADNGPSLIGVPMGFVILGLAALGIFLGIVAFAQGR